MGVMQFDFTDYAGIEYDPKEGCLYLDSKTGMAFVKLMNVDQIDMKKVLDNMITSQFHKDSSTYNNQTSYVSTLRAQALPPNLTMQDVTWERTIKLEEYCVVANILLFELPPQPLNITWGENKVKSTHEEATYAYEQLASYYSILALKEVRKNTSESFKKAIEFFQRSIGAFTVSDELANECNRREKWDKENDVLKIIRATMFTQCHELEFKKSLKDKISSENSFMMAKKTHDCYAWLTMATKHSMNYDEIAVIDVFEFKTDYYRCIVYTYGAINSLKRDKYGEAIGCFQKCLSIIDGTFEKMFDEIPEFEVITNDLTKLREKITENLTKCKYENDTKHKQKIQTFRNFKIQDFQTTDVIYPKIEDFGIEERLQNLFADLESY